MTNSGLGSRGVLALVLVPIVVVTGLLVLIAGSALDASAQPGLVAGSLCATSGPIAGLSADAAQNARTVVAVASARAGESGVLIALMVGIAESGLRILGNPNDPIGAVPVVGVGFDHDSLGIFQQRPSWGTAQQRLDPTASTDLFVDRLLQRPGWQAAQPWEVAQDIQVSAWDGRPRAANHFSTIYGGNYESRLGEATRILQGIQADSAKRTCAGTGGSDLGSAPAGPANGHGLPSGYMIPLSSPAARIAVQAALAELGKPYVFGAAGPATFDCSGLMQWAWARAGIDLPHYTGDQWRAGAATKPAALLPGDLVLWQSWLRSERCASSSLCRSRPRPGRAG
jgi:NlpC/P60 family protein